VNSKLIETIKSRFREVRQRLTKQVQRLSGREKILVSSLAALAVILLAYAVYGPLSSAFSAQAARLEETVTRMQEVGIALETYFKLNAKKEAIESRFKEVEMEEGVSPFLAKLIENSAGVVSGYEIKPSRTRSFGKFYEENSFVIKFTTVDYERLMTFLNELVYGQKPMILTRLEIVRRKTGDNSLSVTLNVSAISRAK